MSTARVIGGASAGIVLAIAAFLGPFEGMRTRAYPDPANPHIATICYGETLDVQFGDVATPEECRARLLARIPDYLDPLDKLLPGLPDNRRIAYADAAYNLGIGILTRRTLGPDGKGVPGTSIVDLERAGRWLAACDRLLKFTSAGGRELAGLVKRRQAEHRLCVGEGSSAP